MNPYAILAAVILWGASTGCAYFYGRSDGKDLEKGKQAEVAAIAAAVEKAANTGAANAIAQAKVHHSVIRGKVETIIRENVVYRDCKHDDAGMRLINDAIRGRPGPASDSDVPGVNAVN